MSSQASDSISRESDLASSDGAITSIERSLGRNTLVMASGTVASRILGFVRSATLAAIVGVVGVSANAFNAADSIPSFIYAILTGGVINSILVPQIIRSYQKGKGDEFVNRLLTMGSFVLALLTAALMAGAGVVIWMLMDSDWSSAQKALATAFTHWSMAQVFFYGIYAMFGQILNARGRFAGYMWAPVLNNVVQIAGFVLFLILFGTSHARAGNTAEAWSSAQTSLLAGTTVVGVAAQAIILLIPLHRAGFRFKWIWGLRGSGLRTTARLAVWSLATVLVDQGSFLFSYSLASRAEAAGTAEQMGAVASNAAMSSALMIYIVPHSVITVSLVTALYTRMSSAAAEGDSEAVRRYSSYGLRTIATFTMFATAILMTLSLPISRLLVPTVSAASIHAIAPVVVAMATGLVPLGMSVLLWRVFLVFQDARMVFWIHVPMGLVFMAGSWISTMLLPANWWVVGIGLSQALNYLAGVVIMLNRLQLLLGRIADARLWLVHLKTGVAALLAGEVGWWLLSFVPSRGAESIVWSVISVVGIGLVMGVVYIVGLGAMRVSELAEFLSPMLNRFKRGAR